MRRVYTAGWVLGALMFLSVLAGCTRERSTPVIPTDTPQASEPEVLVAPPQATPTPEPTLPLATPTPEYILYTVKENETLSTIADKFETDVETLREVNLLTTDTLVPGQVLRIPYQEGMTEEGFPTPTPTPFMYTVQEGDTLSGIAQRFGVSPQDILAVNNIPNPDQLVPGHVLFIPGARVPKELQAGEKPSETTGGEAPEDLYRYVVQPGDTLLSIALKFEVGMDELMAANDITDPNTIRVGQELVIPGYRPDGARTTQVVHVVQPGETLFSIAQRYGVEMDVIVEANGLRDPNDIRAGQKLIIPGVAVEDTQGERRVHVVQPGETLLSIARQYQVTVEELIAANDITDPNTIRVGQELVIP